MGFFRRGDRRKSAPDGWITVEALVDTVHTRGIKGVWDDDSGYAKYDLGYVFFDRDGELRRVDTKERRGNSRAPTPGGRCVIAYDPTDPERFKVLEDENARALRVAREGQRYVKEGVCAPVTVVEARPTGRISRPSLPNDIDTPDPSREAVEVVLRMRVQPPDGQEFEVERNFWDRQNDLSEGSRGWLFYDPAGDPALGIPAFPDAGMRMMGAMGTDPVEMARETFISKVSHLPR